ncbi:MAG: 2-phospho-L-lactate guanylyltransferase [Gammaproteobacteria bacterium]|jgi:2-phospho-L-lactate guanylyltransferase|nr:2-phospho-L-lactate guanylyltransferase [Gammaproteobacteria bacterium]MDP6617728.1 2-phospho-L-lactate guanylyltransferase [Gammaproteobacteria bacterium]MDP6694114.1 2-phospho-L-lactate guanylyltransferase [Gammaproteobacteria bacterium]MDP7041875.1 2-phospho-L-lactate guanylyltransferase [Gammaproteobacteria bacterium]
MNEVWALVPVKQPGKSKSRLLSVLQPDECALLSRSMLMDVLGALSDAHTISRICVLTDDTEVADLVGQLGHTVIRDNAEGNVCESLDNAARFIAAEGADTVFVMPGDMPTVMSADIDALLEKHLNGLSLCPAIRDGGTNAIVCTPPGAVPFKFGDDSASKHLETAARLGIAAERLAVPAFFRDIDLPDDLAWLLAHEHESGNNTIRFLHQSGIAARLNMNLLGASA